MLWGATAQALISIQGAGICRPASQTRSGELFLQEGERAAPCQVGSLLVVPRLGSVIVEGVVDALIDMYGVFLVAGIQRLLVGVDTFIDARVEPGIVEQQRRLNFRNRFRVLEIGRAHV